MEARPLDEDAGMAGTEFLVGKSPPLKLFVDALGLSTGLRLILDLGGCELLLGVMSCIRWGKLEFPGPWDEPEENRTSSEAFWSASPKDFCRLSLLLPLGAEGLFDTSNDGEPSLGELWGLPDSVLDGDSKP